MHVLSRFPQLASSFPYLLYNRMILLQTALRVQPAPIRSLAGSWQQQLRSSHVGKSPLIVPTSTSLSILPFAPVANPSRRQPAALQNARAIKVQGPRGTILVPLQDYVNVSWMEDKNSANMSASDAQGPKRLTVNVLDATNKRQHSTWGLTRALLANAIEGVEDGHAYILRLVGVGYRAAIEKDPFPRPDKFETAFHEATQATPDAAAANFSSEEQLKYYSSLVKDNPRDRYRLVLRLGFAHPVFMSVPRGIECTTPSPTRIIIKGVDKEQVGLFAAQIRRWRPPEPYKGKGIFVNDETIRLKTPKKK